MGVKDQGLGGTRCQNFAIHRRDGSGHIGFHGSGIGNAPFFHHFDDKAGILAQLLGVVPGVGNGTKLYVFSQQRMVPIEVARVDFLAIGILRQ